MGVFLHSSADEPSTPRSIPAQRRAARRTRARGRLAPPLPDPATTPAPVTYLPTSGQQSPPSNARRPLTASAQRVKLDTEKAANQLRTRLASSQVWQKEAFEAYDSVGELKYAVDLVAKLLSRVRIYPGAITDPGRPPAPVDDVKDLTPGIAVAAHAALSRLDKGSPSGLSGILHDLGVNLTVTGECFLTQIPAKPGIEEPEEWGVRSVEEIVVSQSKTKNPITRKAAIQIALRTSRAADKESYEVLPDGAFVARIFRSHARFSDEPTSSLRPLLPLVEELLLLNQMFRATELSRLNAGLLYVPDGLSMSSSPGPVVPLDGSEPTLTPEELEDAESLVDPALTSPTFHAPVAPVADEEDEFELDLIDALTTPIQDPSSASAVVPLVVRGPAELGEKIRHITFARDADEYLTARADRVLERILQGIDLPKDVVTGLANVKYTNSKAVEESLLKAHIEPLALLAVDALTRIYLRPALVANGYTPEQANRVTLWFDTSDAVNRPDRTEDADKGYGNYALSGSIWRKTHGFDETAAPTPNEMVLRMLQNKGSFTPELTEALLRVAAPMMLEQARQAGVEAGGTALPPEVEQALGISPGAAPAAPAPGTPEGAALAPQPGAAPDPTAAPAPTPPAPATPQTTEPGAPQ